MSLTRRAFPALTLQERTEAFYSPEAVHRFKTRLTHKWATLPEFVRAGAAATETRRGAGSAGLKYAKRTVAVRAFGQEAFFEVAPVKNWDAALQQQAEKFWGVRCRTTLTHNGRPLHLCKLFEMQPGAAPAGVPVVEMHDVVRGTTPVRGAAPAWKDYKRRLVGRLCRRLPAIVAAQRGSDGGFVTPAEAAQRFVFSRAKLVPLVRKIADDDSLVLTYGGGDGSSSGAGAAPSEAAWMGTELTADHSGAGEAAARASFRSAHALTDADMDEVAQNAAIECLAALGEPLELAARRLSPAAAVDAGHVGALLRTHFARFGDDLDGLVLSADRCACGGGAPHTRTTKRRGGGERHSGEGHRETPGADTARDLGFGPIGAEAAQQAAAAFVPAIGADLDIVAGADLDHPDFASSSSSKAGRKAHRSARKGRHSDDAALPPLPPLEPAARPFSGRALPALVPIYAELPPLVPIAGALPPLVPIAALPPLVPIRAELPPLVPIRAELPPLVPIAGALPPLVPIEATLPALVPIATTPAQAASVKNFAPSLQRISALYDYDDLVVLAPTDAVFTPAHAAAMARLSDNEFRAAVSNYIGPDPKTFASAGAPVTLHMNSGARHVLTQSAITTLPNPAIAGATRVNSNLLVYAHNNLL